MGAVLGVESGGVDGDLYVLFDKAGLAGPLCQAVKDAVKSPFFSRRCWAFCSVV